MLFKKNIWRLKNDYWYRKLKKTERRKQKRLKVTQILTEQIRISTF